MISTVSASPAQHVAARRDGISLARLLWVAPLALVIALAMNSAIKLLVLQLNPAYQRMGQLQEPLVILTIEGVVAAVVVFVLVAVFVPRPIFWYRVLGVVALLLSFAPDLALAMGGQPMFTALRFAGTLTSIGMGPPPGGPPPGGGAGGPPPAGFNFSTPWDQVLILMSLHVATAIVCIALLTTLTRRRRSAVASERF